MKTDLTTEQMMADLTITFPGLWKRRLSEFGPENAGRAGVWTGADGSHRMPDGDQIFYSLSALSLEAPYINGPVHEGFEVWLANRGWAWENHDGATFFLLPLSAWEDMEAAAA